jgi:predicted phosphodiesterase
MTQHPYRRVAVLSDIHANLPALEAALADAESAGAEAFVLNGDIALGPMPAQTLDLLAGLGDRAIWVHGNCERELISVFDGEPMDGPTGDAARATASLIDRVHRDRLDGLPLTVTLDIDGLGPTLFCHASPRRDDEMVLVDSPPEHWTAVLDGVTADTVVLGHTHMQFDRLAGGRRVINAGSVGMPYGSPGACWALLGPTVQLRQTDYDPAEAASRICASGYEGARQWAEDYVLQHASAAEALAAFTEIAKAQAAR